MILLTKENNYIPQITTIYKNKEDILQEIRMVDAANFNNYNKSLSQPLLTIYKILKKFIRKLLSTVLKWRRYL